MKMLNELHGRMIALVRGLNRAEHCKLNVKASVVGRAIARLHSDEEGQALVEIAVAIFWLTLIGVSALWIGEAITWRTQLDQAAYQGALALRDFQNQTETGGLTPCDQALTAIQQNTASMNQSKLGITYKEDGAAVSGSSCVNTVASGGSVEVILTYPASFGPFFGGSFTLTESSTMRVQ
jgi:Flp pilus assembly protein TadG